MASSGLIGPVGKCTLWRVSFMDDGHGFPSRPNVMQYPHADTIFGTQFKSGSRYRTYQTLVVII